MKIIILILLISLYKGIVKIEINRSKIETDDIIEIEFQYYDADYPNLRSQIDCKFDKKKYCPKGIEMHSFELYIKSKNENLEPIKRDGASYANINILCPEIISQSVYNLFDKNVHTIIRNFKFKKLNSCMIIDKENIDPFTKMHAMVFNVDGNEENHTPAFNIDNNEHDFKNNSFAKNVEYAINKKLQKMYFEKLEEIKNKGLTKTEKENQNIKHDLEKTADLNESPKIMSIKKSNEDNFETININPMELNDGSNTDQKVEVEKNKVEDEKNKVEDEKIKIKVLSKDDHKEWTYIMNHMALFLFTIFY